MPGTHLVDRNSQIVQLSKQFWNKTILKFFNFYDLPPSIWNLYYYCNYWHLKFYTQKSSKLLRYRRLSWFSRCHRCSFLAYISNLLSGKIFLHIFFPELIIIITTAAADLLIIQVKPKTCVLICSVIAVFTSVKKYTNLLKENPTKVH